MLKLTVVVDNMIYSSRLMAEHGFSMLIEQNEHKILFDLGASDLFLRNLIRIGLRVSDITKLIISHRHNDHSGGLPYFLDLNSKAAVCSHPALFLPVYNKINNKYQNIGVPFISDIAEQIREERYLSAVKPLWIDENVLISGEIKRNPNNISMDGNFFIQKDGLYQKTHMVDDISLFIKTDKGLVIVVGCAHAGIVNIIETAIALTKVEKIHYITGGMHMSKLRDDTIKRVVKKLNKFDIENIALSHCSGVNSYCIFRSEFKGNVLYTGSGFSVEI